jgi:hypothetical protein
LFVVVVVQGLLSLFAAFAVFTTALLFAISVAVAVVTAALAAAG